MFNIDILKILLLIITNVLISTETGTATVIAQEKPVLIPTITVHKNTNIKLPIEGLLDTEQECPRLQNMGEKLLNDSEHCDIIIEVIDPHTNLSKTFCAHKSVLCLRSTVLADKIRNLTQRIDGHGHDKPLIKVPGIQPPIFKNDLKFIYTDKLFHDFNLKDHIMDLYVAAQRLNVTDLVKLAEEYLYQSVTINDASSYLKWATKYKLIKIKTFILDFARNTLSMSKTEWRSFLKNVCEAYGYTLAAGYSGSDIFNE